jgi:hypothetical protein
MWSTGSSIAAALVFTLASAPAIGAQAARPTGVVDGVVTDTNLVPLSDAAVGIQGSNTRVSTGANGRFRIVGVPAGELVLVVSRTGFLSASIPVQVAGDDTLRVSVELKSGTDPDMLTAAAGLAAFEERRKGGRGQFKNLAEIERLAPKTTRDLLRSFTTIRVVGTMVTSARQNIVEDPCTFQLFLNGTAIRSNSIDDLPVPKDIAAVEIYANPANVPLSFKQTREADCGAVAIWTKTGR